MQNFLNKVRDFFKKLWDKTSTLAKIIIGVAILLLIILIVVLVSVSSRPDMVPLVRGSLSEGDYTRVKQELDARGIKYKANPRTRNIYVSNPNQATKLKTELALEDKLQDKDGYELFDQQNFTTTEFERSVKLQRSMKEAISLHLESLDEVERAEVEISFPKIDEDSIWDTDDINEPLTASVIVTPSPGSEISDDKKRIKGIQRLVAKGVDRLEPESVHVFDHRGNELTALLEDDEDSDLNQLMEFNRFRQRLKSDIKSDIESILRETFLDGYTLAINTDINREKSEKVAHRIEPVVISQDNPDTPNNESEIKAAIPISESKVQETYRGQVFIPEGSPSPDFTIPPGGKQISDQYNTYQKDSDVKNYEIGSVDEVIDSPAGDQVYINASVAVDYKWEWQRDPETNAILEDPITRKRLRNYTPVEQDVLDKIKNSIKAYINDNSGNPGQISVETLEFRTTKEKHNKEDEAYFRKKDTQRILLYSAIALGVIILLVLLFFWIRGIIRERRRKREEELARQRQAMREAALRAAEQEGVILDMSPEDKARLEMQENAIKLARERPEDVAKLLRTWMSED